MRAIAALALDFDGVIADSMGLQERVWSIAIDRLSPPVPESSRAPIIENLWRGRAGDAMFEGVSFLDPERKRSLRKLKDDLWNRVRDEVPLIPGASQGIRRFSQTLPLTITTTAERDYVEGILQREGLLDQFSDIVTNRDVDAPKPAPDLILRVAERLRVEPRAVLLVGDTASDLQMAEAAGCQFLLLEAADRPAGLRALPGDVERARSWAQLERKVLRSAQPMFATR